MLGLDACRSSAPESRVTGGGDQRLLQPLERWIIFGSYDREKI
jgi:hypothetical protein